MKKKYGDKEKGLVPKLKDFGSIILIDKYKDKKIYFYSIMPKFKQTLCKFLES